MFFGCASSYWSAMSALIEHEFFARPALEVAPDLLGAILRVASQDGTVSVRITEVEAYHGLGTPGVYDPGSHSKDRRTARNASMFGPPGHAYVYFTYGMHYALNMVCMPAGAAAGVLIRSGEIVEGEPLARQRRSLKRGRPCDRPIPRTHLARGPGNLATALGIHRDTHDGRDLLAHPFRVVAGPPPERIASGPRVGVAGEAGGPAFPWRFWDGADPTVSAFRPGRGAPTAVARRSSA